MLAVVGIVEAVHVALWGRQVRTNLPTGYPCCNILSHLYNKIGSSELRTPEVEHRRFVGPRSATSCMLASAADMAFHVIMSRITSEKIIAGYASSY